MSSNEKSPLTGTAKAFTVQLFKLLGIGIAFVCRIVAMILTHISEFLERVCNGKDH